MDPSVLRSEELLVYVHGLSLVAAMSDLNLVGAKTYSFVYSLADFFRNSSEKHDLTC